MFQSMFRTSKVPTELANFIANFLKNFVPNLGTFVAQEFVGAEL